MSHKLDCKDQNLYSNYCGMDDLGYYYRCAYCCEICGPFDERIEDFNDDEIDEIENFKEE